MLVIYVLLVLSEQRAAALSVFVLGLGLCATGYFPSFWGLTLTTLVMLTRRPSPVRTAAAVSPAAVVGSLIWALGIQVSNCRAWSIMAESSNSVSPPVT